MRTDLEAAIARVEDLSIRMANVVEARTIEARGALLTLRRENGQAIEQLQHLVESNLPVTDRALESEFHARFRDAQRAISSHMGKWPVTLIGDDPAGFQQKIGRAHV